ncbi:PQQ-like beta-propeller repeat protein [Amorphus orientalis]|uniref:Outer membrane protein assembly factor BamB n=1 Tax=Amorphus orientalis TaxID=649198 RepID=A0AAE3VNZ0_9HYPH|nr:PQQ-like beta-propeller repeat protein [Amorphus orientalis]MDQ0315604.1 outer membrane protein assembly factor BamB [Amorphus orientalis]
MTVRFGGVVGLAAVLVLSGCGSVGDTVSSINPFHKKDTILPGERSNVFQSQDAPDEANVTGTAVSIGSASAMPDWPAAGGDARNNPGHVSYSGSGGRAWRASIGGGGGSIMQFANESQRISARPVVGGGFVIVYSPDATVTALSLSSGGRAWSTNLRPEKERDVATGGGAAIDGGKVFVATGYGTIAALDLNSGNVIWQEPLDVPARGSPTASGGKVFVVNQSNEVVAVNQSDGSALWTYRGIPEKAGLLTTANPAVSGDTVVVPMSSGEVMALSISEGQPKWIDSVTRSTRTLAVAGLTDVSGSPVIDGNTVFAAGVGGRTIAVSLANGERIWEQNIGSASTPIVSGNGVFVIDLDGRMVALERSSGKIAWRTALPQPGGKRKQAWNGPVLAGNSLWAISSGGDLVSVNPADGAIRAQVEPASHGYTSPVVASGTFVFVSDAGEISALR